jgi:hypothetical protein
LDEKYGRYDVTDIIVSRFLIDGKLEVLCEALNLGDPSLDMGKTLIIEYSFDGKRLRKSFREHSIARLP